MFWSYEATQIARFGLMALLSGVAILLVLRFQADETTPRRSLRQAGPAAAAVRPHARPVA